MEKDNITIGNSKERISTILLTMLDEDINITLTVIGDSMFPLWRHKRDKVILTNCDKAALKKGDIPLYRRENGQYVIHRIVKVNKDTYNLCGDAQTQIEYNLSKENIIAVVKAFIRKEKEYNCDNLKFRVYSILWIWMLPLRGIILKSYKKLSGVLK